MSQIVIDLNPNEDFSSQNYMVSRSNEEAYKWVNQWPEWPGHCVIIYGPESSGKSHLVNIWVEKTEAVILQNADDPNIQSNTAIDNFDDPKWGAEFLFHAYNSAKENGKFLLLTAKQHPKKLDLALADLRSRLFSCPSIPINPPDDELLKFILAKSFADRQLRVSPEVANYILQRVERSFPSIKEVVDRLDSLSLEKKRNITVPLAKEVLENL